MLAFPLINEWITRKWQSDVATGYPTEIHWDRRFKRSDHGKGMVQDWWLDLNAPKNLISHWKIIGWGLWWYYQMKAEFVMWINVGSKVVPIGFVFSKLSWKTTDFLHCSEVGREIYCNRIFFCYQICLAGIRNPLFPVYWYPYFFLFLKNK